MDVTCPSCGGAKSFERHCADGSSKRQCYWVTCRYCGLVMDAQDTSNWFKVAS